MDNNNPPVPREILQQIAGLAAINPQLMEVEKQELRLLAQEGRPLWKILKSSLDYARERREAIAMADLNSEDGLKLARQRQLEMYAALNFTRWFVECFDDPKLRAQRKEHQ